MQVALTGSKEPKSASIPDADSVSPAIPFVSMEVA